MQSNSRFFVVLLAVAFTVACADDAPPGEGGAGGDGSGRGGAENRGGGSGSGAAGAGASGMPGAAGAAPGDDLLFVPESLPATELNAEGGLRLVALTLAPDSRGPRLYAAVKNDGDTPACEAGMTIELKDKSGMLVATAAGTLVSGHFYRLEGGTGVVISCLPPTAIGMLATTELPESIVIEELGSLEYAFPAFTVSDIVAVGGLSVSAVGTVMTASGHAFTGTVTNDFTETLTAAKVTLFTLNRVGRPFGVATSNAAADLAPGDSWTFQTNSLSRLGAAHAGFATASYPF